MSMSLLAAGYWLLAGYRNNGTTAKCVPFLVEAADILIIANCARLDDSAFW